MLEILKDIRDIKRFNHIVSVFAKNGFGKIIHHIDSSEKIIDKASLKEIKPHIEKHDFFSPKSLKDSFEELGGAFIKLGQLLSLREDLIPKEYAEELRVLQDNVAPFSYSEAKKIIEAELHASLEDLFLYFEKKPLAAASIGQVHLAELKNNKRVVVKVQRPGIYDEFQSDIDILYFISEMIEKYITSSVVSPTLIVKEFEEYTKKELDYTYEAKNIDIFHKNSLDQADVVMPSVYWDYVTSKVLVMDYINGVKLKDAMNSKELDRKNAAKKYVNAIYKQVFYDGLFHADPHPGNVIIVNREKIAFIDFGIVGYLDPDLRDNLIDLFYSLIKRNSAGIADSIVRIGMAKHGVNKKKLASDIHQTFSNYYGIPLRELKISSAFKDIIHVSEKHHIKLPTSLMLLSKCTLTTESVVGMLDPSFNPLESAKPFIEELIKKKYSPKNIALDIKNHAIKLKNFILRMPDLSDEITSGLERGEYALEVLHRDMNEMTVELDRSSNRIAMSLLITALLIASSLAINLPEPKILGIPLVPFIGYCIAFLLCLMLLFSIHGEKKVKFKK
ncbi:MAG: AarF/UbiB family protein [archaeon]